MQRQGAVAGMGRLVVCLAILLLGMGGQLLAQAGALDVSFNPGSGTNNFVNALAIQPDGKILIGGNFTSYNGTPRTRIARLNTDGTVDLTFNPGTGCNANVQSVVIQPDGKILLGGSFTSYNGNPRSRIVRILSTGAIDPSFTIGTGFSGGSVSSISLQSNGFLIVSGTFTSFSGVGRNRILRLTDSGALDAAFNPGFGADDEVWTTAIQADGKVLIGGRFNFYNGVSRNRIARLNTDGSLDAGYSVGTGFNNSVQSIVVQPDGKAVIGGFFTLYNSMVRNRIIRLTTSGALDNTFNPGTGFSSSTVHAISIQGDGKLVVVGGFTAFNGVARNRIARLNVNGTLDLTLNPGSGFNLSAYAVALQSDGRIVVGGQFLTYNGTSRVNIARILSRLNCDKTTCVGRALTFTPTATNGQAYAWNFGDNTTSSTQVPTKTYFTVGTYTVNLELTDANGCVSTQSQSVCVHPKLSASLITVNPSCATVSNGMIDLVVSGGAPGATLTYQWTNGATTQDISGLSAGNYGVTVTDPVTGCTQMLSATLTNPIPPKYGIVASGPITFCPGGSVTLDAGFGYSTYLWSTGASTQTITATTGGTYSVTVTSAPGCQLSASMTVTVHPLPPVAITYTPIGCVGVNGILSATVGYVNYSWSTGATTANITVTQKGPYSVTVTDANGCTNSTSIFLNPASTCPTPVGLSVTAVTSNVATLSWTAVPCAQRYQVEYRKVGTVPSTSVTVNAPATSTQVTGLIAGTTYEWRIKTDCGQGPQSPWSVYVPFTTPFAKVDGASAESKVPEPVLFPNPNDGKFTVTYHSLEVTKAEVCVWDVNGKRVFCEQKTVFAGENTWEMEFKLSSGVYFFRIEPLTQGQSEPKRIRFVVE